MTKNKFPDFSQYIKKYMDNQDISVETMEGRSEMFCLMLNETTKYGLVVKLPDGSLVRLSLSMLELWWNKRMLDEMLHRILINREMVGMR